MITEYMGPCIRVSFDANELLEGHTYIKLLDGYTYERIFINRLINITELSPYMLVNQGDHITFPEIGRAHV